MVGRRVQRESLNRRSGRTDLGSLPDLATVRHWPALTPIPHSDAMLLCRQKRHELAVMLERQEQRRRRTITLRLGDFQVDTFSIIIDAGRGHRKAAMHRPAVRPSVCLSVCLSLCPVRLPYVNAVAPVTRRILQVSRQRAAAASVLRYDSQNEDRHRLVR